MKTAKLFLCGMYVHLFLSILVPVMLLRSGRWTDPMVILFLFYLFVIILVLVLGVITVLAAIRLYIAGKLERIKEGWRLLKLASIPFYFLNFIWSILVWFLLTAGSRGILGILIPIPILITCTMIAESGCLGILYIKGLRKNSEKSCRPNGIHYVLQLISVLDIVSTLIILRKNELCHEKNY